MYHILHSGKPAKQDFSCLRALSFIIFCANIFIIFLILRTEKRTDKTRKQHPKIMQKREPRTYVIQGSP